MCVCVCVCVCVFARAYVHVRERESAHARSYVQLFVSVICVHVYPSVCLHVSLMCTQRPVCICKYLFVCCFSGFADGLRVRAVGGARACVNACVNTWVRGRVCVFLQSLQLQVETLQRLCQRIQLG